MHKRPLLCVAALLLLVAVPAAASTFVGLSHTQLVRQSEAVVEGRVIELNSFWSDSGRMVVTEALVAVDEVILGKADPYVRVRTFGGQVGDMLIEAHGFPQFEQGQQVILFLAREAKDASMRVVGYQQGHFEVVTRLDGVKLAVPTVDEEARLIAANGRPLPEPKSARLGAFKSYLRELSARDELRRKQ